MDENLMDLCLNAVLCFKIIIGTTEVWSIERFSVPPMNADRTSYPHPNQTLSYAELNRFIKVKLLHIKHLRYSVPLESLEGQNHLEH